MRTRWENLLWPSLAVFLVLVLGTQLIFISMSFYEDLGFGLLGTELTFASYIEFFTESFYLNSLFLTLRLSATAVALALILAFPAAYVLARSSSPLAGIILSAIVASSFITIVIKAIGINILLGGNGPVNAVLTSMMIIEAPIRFSGEFKVLVGLVQYTLGFLTLLLYGIIKGIPASLEDAARIHGASALSAFFRIVVPLALPGVVNGGLIVFNLCMGAFTSAALLGGGRVHTLPVLVYQTLMVETRYAMAATISALLLLIVVALNLISVVLIAKGGKAVPRGVRG